VQTAGKHARLLRRVLLATVAPMFVYVQGGRLMREIDASRAAEGQKAILAAAVTRLTAPGDVVLVDPEVESQWLDFERRSGRPTWVMWKFAPTNDAELIKWYRRIELRKAVFEEGCGADIGIAPPVFLLTTPATASRLAASCGPEVFHGGPWVLVARNR
jgi:hypothetical protein